MSNQIHPPAIIDGFYKPKIGKSGLYYGRRNVMKGHNFPADDISDGVGGPKWGPNCPAGRTLRTDKIDVLNKNWIFQGYSGMIYCAKEMKKRGEGHDGYCGPDNGSPCDSCLALIYDENGVKDIIEKISTPKVHKTSTKGKRSGTIF